MEITELPDSTQYDRSNPQRRFCLGMEVSQELILQFRESVGSEVANDLSDLDCVRFLRARNGNIVKASTMATNWYTWWHTSLSGRNPESVTPATILHQIDDQWEPVITDLCPHALEGFDRQGRPIYWVRSMDPLIEFDRNKQV